MKQEEAYSTGVIDAEAGIVERAQLHRGFRHDAALVYVGCQLAGT